MENTFIKKCDCCSNRILFIRGHLIYANCDSDAMIPVADLPIDDLKLLMSQITAQLEKHLQESWETSLFDFLM